MRINGQPVTPPCEEELFIPRGKSGLFFKAVAVPDFDAFNKMCPEPQLPMVLNKQGLRVPDPQDPNYKSVLKDREQKLNDYVFVYSLGPSNIEWDNVAIDNPGSWCNWQSDLKAAGLTTGEVNRIVQLVMDANGLNEAKIAAARDLFRLGKVEASQPTSSQSSEPASTPSGELAAV